MKPSLSILVAALSILTIASVVFAGTSGPSPVPPPPSFTITSPTPVLCRGMVNYIPFTITNNGYPNTNGKAPPMQNIELSLVATKGLYAAGNGIAPVSNINPNAAAIATLPIFVGANASAFVPTSVQIIYYYDALYSDTELRNISFTTQQCPLPLSLDISPYILTSGTIENITLTLRNNGTAQLDNVSVKLSVPNSGGALLTSQPVQIKSIAPNSTISLNERLYVAENQSDQSTPLNVTVNFYNGNQLEQISSTHTLLASGIINMTASGFTTSPSVISPPGVFSVSFILTNIGTSGATAVMVTPLPPKGFTVYGSNSTFVGSVGINAQTPVTVSFITSNAVRSGEYTIPIKISYLNNLRQNITKWANTTVSVGAPSALNGTRVAQFRTSSPGGGSGIIILVLIIIIAALAFLLYSERKKRRAK